MKPSAKKLKKPALQRDPRKQPRAGYDERFPNKQFPINSNKSIDNIKK